MILILGGTSESRELAILCTQQSYSVLYTSTTDIIDELPQAVERWIGFLSPEVFENLIRDRCISCVVDATHPFAVEISRQAMDVCSHTKVPYLRLEREALADLDRFQHVHHVATVEEAGRPACATPGKILSTIGVRKLPELASQLGKRKDDLIVRVLPTVDSLATCEELGLHTSQIVAMQGPFSTEFDAMLIRTFGVTVMIVKESGNRGGLTAKIQACKETDCRLLVIGRPFIAYPQQVATPLQCLLWIEKHKQRNLNG
ncbi:MAG: precorrin-6A reductase [Chitinivibrionales bacterium]|nr:precorrin-6A reductase [Chitinivibrionales bacterium]